MRQLFAFVKKEFYHILRDKRTILVLLGIPIAQILIFGFALSSEIKNVKVAVYDLSKDNSTKQIINRLQASEYFDIVSELKMPGEINDIFRKGDVELVVVFDQHFSDNLLHTGKAGVQLIVDASDPNASQMVIQYASSIIGDYQQELLSLNNIPFQIIPQIKMLYNPQLKSAYNFVPGIMGLILMLICAMMTSIAIVKEKEVGTMEVLLVSPIKPIYIILAKVIPYFVLSCVNLVTILLLSVYVLGVPVSGNLFWLFLFSFTFIVGALSLGILISSIVKTQAAAMLISGMGLMMPVMLLSGMIFPNESMPSILQWISNIIPAKWYIIGIKKIMIQGQGILSVAKEFGILLGMAVFLTAVSLKKFKIRLQ